MFRAARFALALAIAGLFAPHATQAAYPERQILVLVPFVPGAGADIHARILFDAMKRDTGVTFVIENKAGANGNIAMSQVAGSNDGYTILYTTSAIVLNPSIYKELTYDVMRDFSPVSQVLTGPMDVVVNPKTVPVKTLQEFLAYAKANPGKLAYASGGIGNVSHLFAVMFEQAAGFQSLHVPYKGGGDQIKALLSGEVQYTFGTPSSTKDLIKSGDFTPIVVTSANRLDWIPNVPTMNEAVKPGLIFGTWHGVFTSKKTSAADVRWLNAAVVKALQSEELKAKFREFDSIPMGTTQDDFAKFVQSELSVWPGVIKGAGIEPQ